MRAHRIVVASLEMLQVVKGSLFGLPGARKPLFDDSEFLPACIAERFERIEFSEIIRRHHAPRGAHPP